VTLSQRSAPAHCTEIDLTRLLKLELIRHL